MNALVTGGTGFVGNILVTLLCARNDRVTVVTRNPETVRSARAGVKYERLEPALSNVSAFDAVVHLAGEPIADKRWNDAQKRRLWDSRIGSTKQIVEAIAKSPRKPRVLLCASAVGYYGDRGEELLDESAGPADNFLGRLCVAWEAEARKAEAHGVRVASIRIGVVLGRSGGALKKMVPLFRLGLGGPLGSGRQWWPWVHVNDLCALILFAIDEPGARGALNGVSPGIVRNREFARTLGRVLSRPAILPAPRFALRLALGEIAIVLTESQHCTPKRALELGFRFAHPDLESALRNLLNKAR